ncbi:hypothetical protein [Ketogulonicigenium robustum]|nr:hypothetical protein [Ketogulonicigenium robustum]
MTPEQQRALALARARRRRAEAEGTPRESRGFWTELADNVIGFDDGVDTPGENIGKWVNRAIESATFGLVGDESNAAANAVLLGRDYENERDRFRANEESLGTAGQISADIAGALVPGLGMAGAAVRGANGVGQMAIRGAAMGAAGGATHGFMEGESGAERAVGFGVGTGVGGILGGAAPYVGAGIQRGVRAYQEGARNRAIGNQFANELGIDPIAGRYVQQTLAAENPEVIADAIQRGGPRAMLADLPSIAGDVRSHVNAPGPAASLAFGRLNERAAAEAQDLTAALDRTMGTATGVRQARGDVATRTADARRQAYDAAYAQPIDYSAEAGSRLLGLQSRLPARAVSYANELMRLRGEQSRQIMAQIGEDGAVAFSRPPDVRQWDFIKQALDQMAESGDGAGALGGQTRMGAAYQGLSRDIRNSLTEAVPAYRTAINTAADAIGESNAIRYGSELLRDGVTRHDVTAWMQNATRPEIEAAQTGLRSQIDHILGRVRQTPSNLDDDAQEISRVWGQFMSRNNQEKMSAILGDEWPSLLEQLERTGAAIGTRRGVSGNSATAMNQATQDRLNEMTQPGPIRQGQVLPTARGLWQNLTGASPEALGRFRADQRLDIVDAFTRGSPQNVLNLANQSMLTNPPVNALAGVGPLNAVNALSLGYAPQAATNWLLGILPIGQ